MKCCRSLILFIWLLSSVTFSNAQNKKVFRLLTVPPAVNYRDNFNNQGQTPNLTLDATKSITLYLDAEGYKTKKLTLLPEDLMGEEYREVVELEPENFKVAIWHFFRYKQPASTIVLVFFIAGVAWQVSRFRRSEIKPENTVGRYFKEQLIGQGGMGEVFKVRLVDEPEGIPMALKLIHTSHLADPEAKERFQREIRIMRDLKHPHLVEIYDWGEEDGRVYFISEFLEGNTCKQVMAEAGDHEHLLGPVLNGVGSAVQHLHERGIVHRDIKPDNIFCASNGVIKLLDLGVVRDEQATALTQTGAAVGTPIYMAPEQSKGLTHANSDQYSLGVLIFEFLTGEKLYEGDNAVAIMLRHIRDPIPSIRTLRPDLSPEFDTHLQKMLAKEPEDRFPDALSAVSAILLAYGKGEGPRREVKI